MLRKALLCAAVAMLFVVSAVQAQPLDQTLSGCNGAAPLRTINATPSTYRSLINGLIPGDRLLLAAGTYTQGLPLVNKHGQAGQCIVIEGPGSGSPALFHGSDSWNLVSLKDSSYIALRNLTLDGLGRAGDGIKAEATSVSVHHILIERLILRNFNQNQQIVGISTKCPAWNWVIRHTTISAAGTGMYLGDSSGGYEFSNSLVEHNLVYNTIGYNAQFKHQLSRSTGVGAPSSGTTIIRHNVFSKETGSSSGSNARPNVLVGHWPLSGAGSTDIYQVYGNVFYQNPYDALFQGEGNVALHDNLFVNRLGTAVRFQAHNSVPRRLEVFNNTVVANNTGISITSADTTYTQRVVGNAVFASTPLTGGTQSNNVTNTYNQASTYLNNPTAALGSGLDLYPKTGQLQGTAIDHSVFSTLLDYNRDFNGTSRNSIYRGAYSGAGTNPGWTIALAIKPELAPPPPTGNVLQSGVPVTGISGAHASEQFWTLSVPSGAASVQFQIAGGTGDADLYVRYGSAPTLTTWDCRPYAGDSNETCNFNAPTAGTWHVMLVGDGAYSGVTLTGTICTALSDVEPNNSFSGAQVLTGSCNQISGTFLNDATNGTVDWFRVSLPAGRTVTALLDGLTQDYDLEIYDGAGNYVAWSYACCNNPDQASWTNTTGSAMNVHIQVYRPTTRTRTTYQLKVSY